MRNARIACFLALLLSGCIAGPDVLDSSSPGGETTTAKTSPASESTTPPISTSESESPSPDESQPPAKIPVVRITNLYRRVLSSGSEWQPPFPGYHGCSDTFSIDEEGQRIWIHRYEGSDYRQYNESQMEAARLALSTPTRNPETYYRNNGLELPANLPHASNFTFGNIAPYNRTLAIESDAVSFNGTKIRSGEESSQRFDYDWRRSDGVVIRVEETILLEYLGDWQDALGVREEHMCI